MMIEMSVKMNEAGRFYELTCGKASMSVSVCRHFVTTCFHNASSALRRHLFGKTFHGTNALDLAAAAYKSSEAKAMLHAVQQAERALSTDSTSAVAN